MKKSSILIGVLTLVLLSACSNKADDSDSSETNVVTTTEAVVTSATEAVTTAPIITTTEQAIMTTEEPIFLPSEPYSFTEVSSLYRYDMISVNELAKVFGEPTDVIGRCSEKGVYSLYCEFEGIKFSLDTTTANELELKFKDNCQPYCYGSYEVKESDKEVRLKPQWTVINGDKGQLPRNIKLGCFENAIYDAYNGNKGRSRFAQGYNEIAYDYEEIGRITYRFDCFTDKLDSLCIEWYDVFHWEDIPDSGLPPA